MNRFLIRLGSVVKGVLSGFDRIVFKGIIKPLAYPLGAMNFLGSRGILNKDYKAWMLEQTKKIYEYAEKLAMTHLGKGIIPLPTYKLRKEELAHEQQTQLGINQGLIGVWTCQEQGSSYRAHFSQSHGYPQLKACWPRCNHLYYYFDHADYGFMSIRLQTWFPYQIQIAMNGREWLRRTLEKAGVGFLMSGNKLFDVTDIEQAQAGLDAQLNVQWVQLLNGFLPTVFPMLSEILSPHLSYYWTLWQSEWATDILFGSATELTRVMNSLLRHALISGTSDRVLRYMDRPIRLDGRPYANLKDEVITRVQEFGDGLRVRHWVNQNSVKVYNEKNVLRVETTMNNPSMFKVHRLKEGQASTEAKQYLPLRKGTCDIPMRSQISQDVNNRFIDNLAAFRDETPSKKIFDEVTQPVKKDGQRIRALDPLGKDRDLLLAISDPMYQVSGMTNAQLRQKLGGTAWAGQMTDKQLSAKMSRHFRLLREHGLIKKLPRQNRYMVTEKGKQLSLTLQALLAASTEELMKIAA